MQGRIYTGGFGNLKDYQSAGITPISITKDIPKWAQPMEYWPWLDLEEGFVVNKDRLRERITRWLSEKLEKSSIVFVNFEPNSNPKYRFLAQTMIHAYSSFKVIGEWSVAKKSVVSE